MVKETIAQLDVIVYTPVCNLILFTHTNCNFIRDFPSYMTKAKVLKTFKKEVSGLIFKSGDSAIHSSQLCCRNIKATRWKRSSLFDLVRKR